MDGLLVADPEIGTTRLRWLSADPVEASPAAVEAEVAKLEFLRGPGADTVDLSVLPAERRRFLVTVVRRLAAQAPQRRDPHRRFPILLTIWCHLNCRAVIIALPYMGGVEASGRVT